MKNPCTKRPPLQCRCVLAVLSTFCFVLVPPALAEGDSEYLTIKELVEMGGESEVMYAFQTPAEADHTGQFPLIETGGIEPPLFPRVISSEDGGSHLVEYEFSQATTEEVVRAEEYFKTGEFEKAMAIYQKALEADPGCYVLHSHIGDCFKLTGRFEQALQSYRKAIELNPADYRSYWYEASVLYQMGRYEESRASYNHALALRPGYGPILDQIRSRAEDLGVAVHDDSFVARAGAVQGEGRIEIIAGEEQYWQLYGLCRAIWIGEPVYREKRTGKREHNWTSTEATECLLILLQGYERFGPSEGGPADPEVERLMRILEAGYLQSFLYYELGATGMNRPILLLQELLLPDLEEYISEFVVVSTATD